MIVEIPNDAPTMAVAATGARLRLVPGAIIAGRYRIVSQLGKGGMGEVYRADDLRLGQTVALKFLTAAERSIDTDRQLIDEVRVAREITHPNACRVHDLGEVDGHLFLSMEYIDGEDLASLLRRIGKLPHVKALALAREICSGLAAAHDRGVIHRDLKPGNIMIDGRGHARITDFGLAAFEERDERLGAMVGTPSYMAPEQLDEKPASVASDLFALGLVMFELWTGRRMFTGGSFREIRTEHKRDAGRTAIRTAGEIDPAVVAVIEACLETDPSRRPHSAHAVIAALPGRDALDAAVSAGETPSPAMVAAATDRGALPRAAAWPVLALVAACTLGVAWLSPLTTLPGRAGLPMTAARLEARAQKILEDVGWTAREAPRADTASWFWVDGDWTRWRESGNRATSLLPSMRFTYRQSPRPMIPRERAGGHRITASDPPVDFPGMAVVALASDGRLRSLTVAPPLLEATSRAADWRPLLAAAGFAGAGLRAVPPAHITPVDNDGKIAWVATDPKELVDVRIEAAALRGRPVWFEVAAPWEEAKQTTPSSRAASFAGNVTFALFVALPLALAWLARRNLRRGQGDRKGAFRLAAATLAIFAGAALLRAHHVPDPIAEAWMIAHTLALALAVAAVIWCAYIALEPFARRHWPRALISWTRLLEGRFRDAMVGRDLLVGLAAGSVIGLGMHLATLVPANGQATLPLLLPGAPLSSLTQVLFVLLVTLGEAIGRAAGLLAFLVLLRGILRNDKAAVAGTILLITVANLDTAVGPMPVRVVVMLLTTTVLVLLVFRFGLLSAFAGTWMVLTMIRLPLSIDGSAWYVGSSVLTLAVIATISSYAFYRSLDGKPLLPGPLFED